MLYNSACHRVLENSVKKGTEFFVFTGLDFFQNRVDVNRSDLGYRLFADFFGQAVKVYPKPRMFLIDHRAFFVGVPFLEDFFQKVESRFLLGDKVFADIVERSFF